MRLNSELVRERRRDLGYSQRMLSRAVAMTDGVGRRIEQTDDHHDVTLGELDRLADVLKLDALDLLVLPDEAHRDCSEPVLVARLGSLLARAELSIPTASLASALGASAQSISTALSALDEALRPIGLRVAVLEDSAQLVSSDCDGVDARTFRTLVRRAKARSHLSRAEAKLLYRVMMGSLTAKQASISNDGRVSLRKLVKAGMIEAAVTDTGPLRLSPDVAASLLLVSDPTA
jgi:hypothetical protein